jgi:hypothetical protein
VNGFHLHISYFNEFREIQAQTHRKHCACITTLSVNAVYFDTHPIRSKVKGFVMLKEAAFVSSLTLCLKVLISMR